MSELIATGIIATTLLAAAYIAGSELCLPAARHALHARQPGFLAFASRLVSLGEWALIGAGATLLVIAHDVWHLFTGTLAGESAGVAAVCLLAGAVARELSGRMWKNRGMVMSQSLDLVLPAHGRRREIYESTHQLLETGSRAERDSALHRLLQ